MFNLTWKKNHRMMYLHSMLLIQVDGISSNEDAQTFHPTERDVKIYQPLQKVEKITYIKYRTPCQVQ